MAHHIAIIPGKLYPQPGYTIQVDKDGKWTANQIFLCHRNSALSLMPRPGTSHPDVPFLGMVGGTIKVEDGDTAEITCQYAGAEATYGTEGEKANAQYSMGIAMSEESILMHLRYKDLSADEKKALKMILAGHEKDDQGVEFKAKVTTALGIELLAKIDRGQTSYYSPRVTWKESWVRDKPCTAAELNDLAKISTPTGPAPTLSGNRTYLHNGLTQSQDGKSYKLEQEWLVSDLYGWDVDIYGDPTP